MHLVHTPLVVLTAGLQVLKIRTTVNCKIHQATAWTWEFVFETLWLFCGKWIWAETVSWFSFISHWMLSVNPSSVHAGIFKAEEAVVSDTLRKLQVQLWPVFLHVVCQKASSEASLVRSQSSHLLDVECYVVECYLMTGHQTCSLLSVCCQQSNRAGASLQKHFLTACPTLT